MYDEGQPSPIDEMPLLTFDEGIYYNDFNNLGTERINSMAIGAIPVTKIVQYAMLEGVHNIKLFKDIILSMDRHYMKLVSDDQKAKANKNKAKAKSKRR